MTKEDVIKWLGKVELCNSAIDWIKAQPGTLREIYFSCRNTEWIEELLQYIEWKNEDDVTPGRVAYRSEIAELDKLHENEITPCYNENVEEGEKLIALYRKQRKALDQDARNSLMEIKRRYAKNREPFDQLHKDRLRVVDDYYKGCRYTLVKRYQLLCEKVFDDYTNGRINKNTYVQRYESAHIELWDDVFYTLNYIITKNGEDEEIEWELWK